MQGLKIEPRFLYDGMTVSYRPKLFGHSGFLGLPLFELSSVDMARWEIVSALTTIGATVQRQRISQSFRELLQSEKSGMPGFLWDAVLLGFTKLGSPSMPDHVFTEVIRFVKRRPVAKRYQTITLNHSEYIPEFSEPMYYLTDSAARRENALLIAARNVSVEIRAVGIGDLLKESSDRLRLLALSTLQSLGYTSVTEELMSSLLRALQDDNAIIRRFAWGIIVDCNKNAGTWN